MPDQTASEPFNWRTVHSVIVVLVLAIFLYTVRGILSPFLVFLLLVFVLAPMRGTRLHVMLMSAAGVLTAIWALNATGFLLAPFLLALAFAYIQNPLVTRMERRGISRGWGTGIMAIPTLVILGLIFFVGIPALGAQVTEFIRNTPTLVQRATAWFEGMQRQLIMRDLPGLDEQALLARLRSIQPEQMVAYLQQRQWPSAARHGAGCWAWGAASGRS